MAEDKLPKLDDFIKHSGIYLEIYQKKMLEDIGIPNISDLIKNKENPKTATGVKIMQDNAKHMTPDEYSENKVKLKEMDSTKPKNTFYKLSNGTWAIKVYDSTLKSGDLVEVHKKDGSISKEYLDTLNSNKQEWNSQLGLYITVNIWTIEKKYKKGNGFPQEQTTESNNKPKIPRKLKEKEKYDLYVWQFVELDSKECNGCKFYDKYYVDNDYCPVCNGELTSKKGYNLISELKNVEKANVLSLMEIYKKYGEKYKVLAFNLKSKYREYSIGYGWNDLLIGELDEVGKLFKTHKNKQKLEEMKEKTWLMCKMGCDKFPARSQKIKGVRELGYIVKGMVDYSAIEEAIVVSENLDLEGVEHECYYFSTYNKTNGRVKLDQVMDKTTGKFMRPCPTNPEHGFVDSRLVNTKGAIAEVIEEIRKTGEKPEFIVMDLIDCEYSAVITPDSINLGKGHDGATSGNGTYYIPLELDENGREQLGKMFWDNSELYCPKCHTTGLYKDKNCRNCFISKGENIKLERKWPFIELLYQSNVYLPTIVQLRSGPELSSEKICPQCKDRVKAKYCPKCNVETRDELVKVKSVHQVDMSMPLLEWGALSKKLREDIEDISTDKFDRICPVVWHPGGAISSHFGVHCKETGLPYVTSDVKPECNAVLSIGIKGDTNLEALKEGLVLGLRSDISNIHEDDKLRARKYLKNFLGALHLWAIADVSNREVARFIGYSWGIGIKIIAALPYGEAMHKDGSRFKTGELLGADLTDERDYSKVWNQPLEKVLGGLGLCEDAFNHLSWSHSYGGPKWASCTRSTLKVFEAMKGFIIKPFKENSTSLIEIINVMINEVHNGGMWLNKLINIDDFNNASKLPHFMVSPEIAFRSVEERGEISKFAFSVLGFSVAKQIVVKEPIEIENSVYKGMEEYKGFVVGSIIAKSVVKVVEEPVKQYSQKEISNGILATVKSIKGQIKADSSGIHLQIGCVKINRDYGYANDYSYKYNTIPTTISVYITSLCNEGSKIKSLVSGDMTYVEIEIMKYKDEGMVVFKDYGGGLVIVYDLDLWNLWDKVLESQVSKGVELEEKVDSKKVLGSILKETNGYDEIDEIIDNNGGSEYCLAISLHGYTCNATKNHEGSHTVTNKYGLVVKKWINQEEIDKKQTEYIKYLKENDLLKYNLALYNNGVYQYCSKAYKDDPYYNHEQDAKEIWHIIKEYPFSKPAEVAKGLVKDMISIINTTEIIGNNLKLQHKDITKVKDVIGDYPEELFGDDEEFYKAYEKDYISF